MEIEPVEGATLGARVRGLSLARIDEPDFERVLDAWHTYGVLVFPEQHLDDDEQIAFTRRFGELERLIANPGPGGRPEIGALSSLGRDGKTMKRDSTHHLFLKGNTYWHTDSSYKPVPAKASCLRAAVVPDEGGETSWADMRAAFDDLDDELRAVVESGVAVHSYWYSQSLVGGTNALSEAEWAALPPVSHPMLATHPVTGRKNIYLGRHASHIEGMDEEAGRELIQRINAWSTRPPRVFTHRWAAGDIAIWDNRCVLHRGHEWPLEQPRVMHRTTVAGETGSKTNQWAL